MRRAPLLIFRMSLFQESWRTLLRKTTSSDQLRGPAICTWTTGRRRPAPVCRNSKPSKTMLRAPKRLSGAAAVLEHRAVGVLRPEGGGDGEALVEAVAARVDAVLEADHGAALAPAPARAPRRSRGCAQGWACVPGWRRVRPGRRRTQCVQAACARGVARQPTRPAKASRRASAASPRPGPQGRVEAEPGGRLERDRLAGEPAVGRVVRDRQRARPVGQDRDRSRQDASGRPAAAPPRAAVVERRADSRPEMHARRSPAGASGSAGTGP